MAYAIPGVIQNVVNLKVGEGVELPPTLRNPCNWSNQVNLKLEQMGFSVRVRQSTKAGITTLWRVE